MVSFHIKIGHTIEIVSNIENTNKLEILYS